MSISISKKDFLPLWIPLLQIKTFLLCFLRHPDREACQFHRSSAPRRRFFLRGGTRIVVSLASLRHLLAFTHFFPPPSTPRQRAIPSKLCAAQGPRQYQEEGLMFHLLYLLELLTQCSGARKNIVFKHRIHKQK